jgi:dipeptidyl aminopeptidase/acylaminoacyl peptidase
MSRLSHICSARRKRFGLALTLLLAAACASGQGRQISNTGSVESGIDEYTQQALFKRYSDMDFQLQLGKEMLVRKVMYAGEDDKIIPAYVFTPRDTTRRHPAMIMIHGGVHGDFTSLFIPQVRSLVARGYIVVAPEYRGSTGYGKEHYDALDYGGKEVEDCIRAHDYLAEYVPWADLDRLGIVGWSHGGFITLHAIFRRPELFKVAVAHVPVTDLPTRMKMHSEQYRKFFADQKAFGGTFEQNPKPYLERSPITHARELKVPLLVHAADNDEDVFIPENHNFRDSMHVAGKDSAGLYTFKEWHNPPGGHEFSLVDTKQAHESWSESLAFLDAHLHPER